MQARVILYISSSLNMLSKTQISAVFLLSALEAYAIPQAGTATADAAAAPATFTANPNVGPGGSTFEDSAHFRVYGGSSADAKDALQMLEGAYECFVEKLGWRSTGLSFNEDDSGPWYKTNIYSVDALDSAAGVMHSDYNTGLAWLEVVHEYLSTTGVTVHEWGHGLHYHQKTWVDQTNTGAWWETFAQWVADTYATSDLCAEARSNNGDASGGSDSMELLKVIGDSFQVIVDGTSGSGNYYQAWPFFTYLTNNPANLTGLGTDTLRQMMIQYPANSNEDPLHVLQIVAGSTKVAEIVGSYWAHMAYVDIGHPTGQELFLNQRGQIDFDNVESSGSGSYKVISARAPRYMGANIIPLTTSGAADVEVKVSSEGEFTATLAIFNSSSKETRYVALESGAGKASLQSGEEASLVVANTPSTLTNYNGFEIPDALNKGLDYSFTLSGATA